MSGRRQHHVLEPAQHVRPDDLALVAAGQRRDEHLRAHRHAQVVGPERHQPLDERPIAGDARAEGLPQFHGGDFLEVPARLPAGDLVALPQLAQAPHGVADGVGSAPVGGVMPRRFAAQLRAQPATRIRQAARLPDASPKSETVQRSKCGIHTY